MLLSCVSEINDCDNRLTWLVLQHLAEVSEALWTEEVETLPLLQPAWWADKLQCRPIDTTGMSSCHMITVQQCIHQEWVVCHMITVQQYIRQEWISSYHMITIQQYIPQEWMSSYHMIIVQQLIRQEWVVTTW